MTANEIMLNSIVGKWFQRIYPERRTEYLFANKLQFGGIQMISYHADIGKMSKQHWQKMPSFRSLELIEDPKMIKKLNSKKALYLLKESNKNEIKEG